MTHTHVNLIFYKKIVQIWYEKCDNIRAGYVMHKRDIKITIQIKRYQQLLFLLMLQLYTIFVSPL